jgi:CubicO group peptidase (beta-lactamase class C family)
MRACFAFLLLFALSLTPLAAQEAERLEPGQVVSATLPADGVLNYDLELADGRFVVGRVEQEGVDVMVTVTGPDGDRVVRASRVGKGGPEVFAFSTGAAGRYRMEVAPVTEGAGGAVQVHLLRSEPVATTPEGKVDQAAAYLAEDTPGAVVGVVKGGELAFVRGYGAADLTHGIPFHPDTPTNIGSTSKQFTGFALALLASRGALSLDDDVRTYIPELPDFGTTITVRHLLTHTTGYREFINTLLIAGRQILQGDYIGPDEMIDVVQRQTALQNEPGAEFNYNNTAFSLATRVVAKVTGRTFAEWMRDEVFLPLGMTRTWVRANPGQIIPGRSVGYIAGDGGFQEVRDLHQAQGAGGIYTTPADMARWMGNFRTAELGGPEVIRELTTPYTLTSGESTNYGMGLFIDTNRGLRRWQHGGNDIAHSSTFVYYPDLDAGYVVFSNYQGVPGGIAGVVAEAFFGEHMEKVEPTEGVNVPVATLRRYVGRYEMTTLGGLIVAVELQGQQLRVEVAGQPATALTPTSDTTFAVEGAPARVTFHRDGEETAERITFHQDGDHPGRRLQEDKPAVDLASFEGRYFSEELETFYELRMEEDRLVIRHPRVGTALLTHTEGNTFSGTMPVSQVVFSRDGQGRITGFHAGNGRARDIWFQKVGR